MTKEKQKKPAVEAKAGDDLVAALTEALEERLGQKVESVPNKSGTYSRLLLGGKAFAYIFPPRPNGVALKIPKQLLAVADDLPAGHGFKRTDWGLTRTIASRAEAPTAAQALAVAAAAVATKGDEAVASPAAAEAKPDPKPASSRRKVTA